MGSAISIFSNAQALRVPQPLCSSQNHTRSTRCPLRCLHARFLRKDRPSPEARRSPVVSLDNRYYRLVDDLDWHFPHGPPSLLHCTHLSVQGDSPSGVLSLAEERSNYPPPTNHKLFPMMLNSRVFFPTPLLALYPHPPARLSPSLPKLLLRRKYLATCP